MITTVEQDSIATIAQVAKVDPALIEPLRTILFEAFPPSERCDYAHWIYSIAEGTRWLYTATVNRMLVGFATIMPWIAADIHRLEYLAVGNEYRGKSYGAALLRHVTSALGRLAAADGIIFEVKSDDYGDDAERLVRSRRIAFYKRNGAQMVECPPNIRVPSMVPGEESLNEKLMWIPLRDASESPRGDRLRECIVGIFALDYARGADDALLQETLRVMDC
jgi:GNAT superfamily N-acetyltransferase